VAVVGVGVDVVDVARLAAALERTPGLADRLFAAAERTATSDEPARLAARFAAKEAVSKALGLRGARFLEVEVVSEESGRPTVRVSGETSVTAERAGVRAWHVSLSHDGGVATAFVVAES
jgi:holo-[acyl-carrier protein] synthase